MNDFITGCVGLFTSTFNAAVGQQYFLLIVAVIVLQVTVGIFGAMSHRLRKM